MTQRRIRLARVLLTLPAVFLVVGPPIADFNMGHILNPLWPAHARLHTAWLVISNSLIALIALARLWRDARHPTRAGVLMASALIATILLGFFAAAATQSGYRGALTDPNGIPFQIASVDANLAVFSVWAVIVACAIGLVVRIDG
jgi:hypothetical protein